MNAKCTWNIMITPTVMPLMAPKYKSRNIILYYTHAVVIKGSNYLATDAICYRGDLVKTVKVWSI